MIDRCFGWLWDLQDSLMLGVIALCLLAGCVHVAAQEPAIPFPPAPGILFTVDPTGDICISQADANQLDKWMRKLFDEPDGFVATRERLLKTQP